MPPIILGTLLAAILGGKAGDRCQEIGQRVRAGVTPIARYVAGGGAG
ncbi:MAG: hypothetical protein ACR2LH_02920 [Thermoleophilaceae bacterium]